MGGVPCQKQAAKAHRLGDKTAQRGNTFFNGRPGDDAVSQFRVQAAAQFVPKGLVAPLRHFVFNRALHVVAAARQAAHGAQRKATFMVAINNSVGRHRRYISQHTQPAKGVDPLELSGGCLGHTGPANAMKAVAPGNKVAGQRVGLSMLGITHARLQGVKVMDADTAGLVHRDQAGSLPCSHQIVGHFGLSIGGHDLAARQAMHINGVTLVFKHQLNRMVRRALGQQALASTDSDQHINGALLQNTGPDTA